MAALELDKALLTKALEKVHAIHKGQEATLGAREVATLRLYSDKVLSRPEASERDGVVNALINKVLADFKEEDPPPEKAPKRSQDTLRCAIAKFLQGQRDAISAEELQLMRSSLAKLNKVDEASENHLRLQKILNAAISDFDAEAVVTEEVAQVADVLRPMPVDAVQAADELPETVEASVEQPAAPAPPEEPESIPAPEPAAPVAEPEIAEKDFRQSAVGTLMDANTLFRTTERSKLESLEGIPVELNVHYVEHEGDLTIEGDVPDESLIVVKEGGLTVKGFMFGHAVASGSISIEGNVQGGWVISNGGDIRLARILSGSHLIAPKGSITCKGIEKAKRIFAGQTVHIEGQVRGGEILGRNIIIDDKVMGAELHVLDAIHAKDVESDPRDGTTIFFRHALSSTDYGHSLDQETLTKLRGLLRAVYKAEIGSRLLATTEEDLYQIPQVMLYCVSGSDVKNPTVAELRDLQMQTTYLPVFIVAGEGLLRTLLQVLDTDRELVVGAMTAAVEECGFWERILEQECEQVPISLGQNAKPLFDSACSALRSVGKRIKEAKGDQRLIWDQVRAMDLRLNEWKKAFVSVRAELDLFQERMRTVLGASVIKDQDPAVFIPQTLQQVEQSDFSSVQANASQVRLLKEILDRHLENIEKWRNPVAHADSELKRLSEAVQNSRVLMVRENSRIPSYIRADRFAKGIVFSVMPGVSALKGEVGQRVIALEEAVSGPVRFAAQATGIQKESV